MHDRGYHHRSLRKRKYMELAIESSNSGVWDSTFLKNGPIFLFEHIGYICRETLEKHAYTTNRHRNNLNGIFVYGETRSGAWPIRSSVLIRGTLYRIVSVSFDCFRKLLKMALNTLSAVVSEW